AGVGAAGPRLPATRAAADPARARFQPAAAGRAAGRSGCRARPAACVCRGRQPGGLPGVSTPEFQRSQLAMARYLRDPAGQCAPAGMAVRGLAVYADLVYNNIESFIRSGFPVLHSLYTGPAWQALVRAFLREH